jgi:hypothetical protein
VPGDAVPTDKVDEIPLGIAAQGGFAEMRVLRQEILGRGVKIGEVAAPAAFVMPALRREMPPIGKGFTLAIMPK